MPVGTLADMLVSRAGLSPVMVGRDAELGQLLRLVSARTGGSVALVGGEPGIGKTRLVTELIGALPERTTVLVGQADPGTLSRPYHILLDLVGRPSPEGPLAHDGAAPHARLAAGVDLLRAALGERTTVLVVDDLQWADTESMAVVERLIESPSGRLIVIGTYRPEELTRQHPVAELVQRLERRHSVLNLRLERLVPVDVAGFLTAVFGRPPSHRAAGKLHHRTGGNPFFLEELLKASGHDDADQICSQPLPWTLAEALRGQLDDLEPRHRRVVEAAAVLTSRVSFDMLAAVTGSAEDELIDVLRELVGRGLLVEVEEDRFGFRHALTREVIAGEMLGRERRRLHEAALEVLLATDTPDLAAVAVHAQGAGRYPDMIAAARTGAAERLAAGSTYGALKLAELGLEEDPDDVELLSTAATAAWLASYHDDAQRHAERWLAAADRLAPADTLAAARARSAALRMLVRLAWETSDHKTMAARTDEVRAVVDILPDGPERTWACAAVAQSYMLRSHPEAIVWADRAAEAAARLDLPEVRLSALVEKGTMLLTTPDAQQAGALMLAEVADEAERVGAYLAAARAVHNLFWHVAERSGERADEMLERMRAVAERAGFGGMAVSSYHQGRSWLAVCNGDLDGAIAALEDIDRSDRDWPPVPRDGHRSITLAGLYLERGDLDRAAAILDNLPDGADWQGIAALAFQIACGRGELGRARVLLNDGDLLVTPDQLDDAAGTPGSPLVNGATVLDITIAGLTAGLREPELTAALHEDGVLRPTGKKRIPDPPDDPSRLLVQAALAEAAGRYAEALDGYLRAAESRLLLLPSRLATAHTGAARCLIVLDQVGEAGNHLRQAAALLRRWPGWRRAQLDPLARRLGLALDTDGPAPAPPTGPAELTPREREVVALLAEGLSNAELARRLVISPKTAAVHVSNILAKLGMTSRAQVAAWAGRQPVAPP